MNYESNSSQSVAAALSVVVELGENHQYSGRSVQYTPELASVCLQQIKSVQMASSS